MSSAASNRGRTEIAFEESAYVHNDAKSIRLRYLHRIQIVPDDVWGALIALDLFFAGVREAQA